MKQELMNRLNMLLLAKQMSLHHQSWCIQMNHLSIENEARREAYNSSLKDVQKLQKEIEWLKSIPETEVKHENPYLNLSGAELKVEPDNKVLGVILGKLGLKPAIGKGHFQGTGHIWCEAEEAKNDMIVALGRNKGLFAKYHAWDLADTESMKKKVAFSTKPDADIRPRLRKVEDKISNIEKLLNEPDLFTKLANKLLSKHHYAFYYTPSTPKPECKKHVHCKKKSK